MFDVGDLVLVKPSFLGNSENSIGFVYETYEDFDDSSKKGVSIILGNGSNLGGFSFSEQVNYLKFVRESGVTYEFENVTKLHNDFKNHLSKDINFSK